MPCNMIVLLWKDGVNYFCSELCINWFCRDSCCTRVLAGGGVIVRLFEQPEANTWFCYSPRKLPLFDHPSNDVDPLKEATQKLIQLLSIILHLQLSTVDVVPLKLYLKKWCFSWTNFGRWCCFETNKQNKNILSSSKTQLAKAFAHGWRT